MVPRGIRLPLGAFLHAALLTGPAFAQVTIHVPDDAPTIQGAIALAAPGDTVLVKPGVYAESLTFLGKAVTVKSTDGPATTIVDAGLLDTVVSFTSGEGPDSVLEGFTLRNGRSGFDTPNFGQGGGIMIRSSSPTVLNNVIRDNRACTGAGINVSLGSPLIRDNVIHSNVQAGCSGGVGGGGISLVGTASARIVGNVIYGNVMSSASGGGLLLSSAGTPTIERNTIAANATGFFGGGIAISGITNALVAGNLVVQNQALAGGGIVSLVPYGSNGPRIVGNTIADNQATEGSGIVTDGADGTTLVADNVVVAPTGGIAILCGSFNAEPPLLRSNDVWSPSASAYGGSCADATGSNGNISAEPRFVDPAQLNYRLRRASPAIDAGDDDAPGLPTADLDGIPRITDGNGDSIPRVDMGAFERGPSRCGVELAFEAGVLDVQLGLYTPEPTTWSVFLAFLDQLVPLWSVPLPAVAPPFTYPLTVPDFPSLGAIAVVSVLHAGNDVGCVGYDVAETGGFGPRASALRLRIETLWRGRRE